MNDIAKRLDNGRQVRITEVRPIGIKIIYITEDLKDGHTTLFTPKQLRGAQLGGDE